jgi:hypothetical protein
MSPGNEEFMSYGHYGDGNGNPGEFERVQSNERN